MALTPKAFEQLKGAAYDVRDCKGGLEYSLNLAAFVGERAHHLIDEIEAVRKELDAAHTPGPDVSQLLAWSEAFLRAWEAGGFGCHLIAPDLRAAIAEHEAAVKPPEQGSIVEGIEALREAGGEDWDRVADPAEYLGRKEPDVTPLLAAAKEALDDLISLDEAGWLDRGQQMRMERLGAVIAGHEAAQEGARG